MTLHRRQYRSGSRWAFWRWTDTPTGYITRLHLISTPFGAICLHWINRPDPEPWLHDHPVSFLSVILKGWYVERRENELDKNARFGSYFRTSWNWVNASPNDCHSITNVAYGGCLTLCLMGPKWREWGFHTDKGWEGWKEYNKRVHGK